MKAIHSLWTATRDFRLTRARAITFAAAAAYTNRAFEDTELITDCKGLRIAEALGLDFRAYSVKLQEFCPPYAKHVWALGKVAAQSWQTEPFMHVDNDVLLFHKPPKRILEAKVAVQSIDEPDGYWAPEQAQMIDACSLPAGVVAYNTGVIVWCDLELCRAYCAAAVETAMVAAKESGDGFVCSIIAEQYLLGVRLHEARVRPACMIPMASLATPEDFADCGFLHAWAATKDNAAWGAKIENRFKRDHPEAWRRADRGWQTLQAKKIL